MAHYAEFFCVSVGPEDFKSFWKNQEACYRDGCDRIFTGYTEYTGKNSTDARTDTFIKKAMKSKEYSKLRCPEDYSVAAYDVGTVGWRTTKTVNKIVNHKRKTVQEVKNYKNKPSRVPKGAKLERMVTWVFSFDAREYDPLEH